MVEQNSFTERFAKRFKKDEFEEDNSSTGGFASKFAKTRPASDTNTTKEAKKQHKDNTSFAQDKISKSRIMNERSFADATKRSRADCVFLVRGKDRGKPAWHYVLVDKDKKEMFLAKSRTGSIDVALYGQILHSGWGEDPPQDIVDKVNKEFGGG
ncbi:MAG: hypothetical protein sL5_01260 [Candidatus Mesenet longicola]|uniref:Uncharacterized protein n=1 Tax=Candidatus Mesenet longicola TaxID=1892558 RepID=A0A8J3MNN2_9RICK|nr:MAG: hypothetical protein sGL2_01100 [Candidatus Mesenet longicola]GHM59133.1 MAG: hypothetical protein sL5_01260 [Candidatus Mesenet longicola]